MLHGYGTSSLLVPVLRVSRVRGLCSAAFSIFAAFSQEACDTMEAGGVRTLALLADNRVLAAGEREGSEALHLESLEFERFWGGFALAELVGNAGSVGESCGNKNSGRGR